MKKKCHNEIVNAPPTRIARPIKLPEIFFMPMTIKNRPNPILKLFVTTIAYLELII